VVIALVQLPSEVDAAFWRLDAELDRGAGAVLLVGYQYVNVISTP